MCSKWLHIIESLLHSACICNTCMYILYTVWQWSASILLQLYNNNNRTIPIKFPEMVSAFFLVLKEYSETWLQHFQRERKHKVPVTRAAPVTTTKSCHDVKVACVPFGKIKKNQKPSNNTNSWILFLWRWQITHIFIFIDIWREYFAQTFPTGKLLN